MARRRPSGSARRFRWPAVRAISRRPRLARPAFEPGSAKNTYGTGCFLLLNTGEKPAHRSNNLLTTIGWGIDGRVTYCLEGSVFIGGAVVQWLRDGLGIISNSADVEPLAASVADSGGVYLVPAFRRARRALLGSLCPGSDLGHHARHDRRPHRPGAPSNRSPIKRATWWRPCEQRRRPAAGRSEGRRRRRR